MDIEFLEWGEPTVMRHLLLDGVPVAALVGLVWTLGWRVLASGIPVSCSRLLWASTTCPILLVRLVWVMVVRKLSGTSGASLSEQDCHLMAALALSRRVFGDRSAQTAALRCELGSVKLQSGEPDDAIRNLEEGVGILERDPRYSDWLDCEFNHLAAALRATGRTEEALEAQRRYVECLESRFGDGALVALRERINLSVLILDSLGLDDSRRAEIYDEIMHASARLRAEIPEDCLELVDDHLRRSEIHFHRKEYPEAEMEVRDAIQMLRRLDAAPSPRFRDPALADFAKGLPKGDVASRQWRWADALTTLAESTGARAGASNAQIEIYLEALEVLSGFLPPGHPRFDRTRRGLAVARAALETV